MTTRTGRRQACGFGPRIWPAAGGGEDEWGEWGTTTSVVQPALGMPDAPHSVRYQYQYTDIPERGLDKHSHSQLVDYCVCSCSERFPRCPAHMPPRTMRADPP